MGVKDGEFIGMSWLSKCLEEEAWIPYESYKISGSKTMNKPVGSACQKASDDKKTDAGADLASADKSEDSKPTAGTSYIDRNKHKFVCAQSSSDPSSKANTNSNKHITDQLEKLAAAYKSSNDTWRAFGYQKAIAALKNYPKPITSRSVSYFIELYYK